MRLSRRRRGDAGREAGRRPEPIHYKVGMTPAEKVVVVPWDSCGEGLRDFCAYRSSTLGRSSRALAVSRVEDRGQSRKAAHVSYRRVGLLSVKYERADLLCEWPLCIQRITSGTPASIAVARPPLRAPAPEKEVVPTPVASRPRTIIRESAVGPVGPGRLGIQMLARCGRQ